MSGGPGTRAGAPPRPVTPVAIAARLLHGVRDRLTDGDETGDDVPRADLDRAVALVDGLDPYLARCTSPESPALAQLAGRTRAEHWHARDDEVVAVEQEMLSGHVEGQLLQLLTRLVGARRTLDIGTFTGYSALAVAEALPDDGRVVTCELDPYVADVARAAFAASPHGARVDVEVGPALTTLRALADAGETFDLAFLDADKGGYLDYLEVLLDGDLVRPGGLICVDNTLFQGEAYLTDGRSDDGASIAAFNRAVADDPRVTQVLLPLRDGVTLIHVHPEPR